MTKYICARKTCGKEVTTEDLKSLPGIKCPNCGYRILYKKRPSVVRKISAK